MYIKLVDCVIILDSYFAQLKCWIKFWLHWTSTHITFLVRMDQCTLRRAPMNQNAATHWEVEGGRLLLWQPCRLPPLFSVCSLTCGLNKPATPTTLAHSFHRDPEGGRERERQKDIFPLPRYSHFLHVAAPVNDSCQSSFIEGGAASANDWPISSA